LEFRQDMRPHHAGMTQECVLFFVKWPEPGQVKTRLAAALGDEHAVGLYRCFVLDLLAALAQNPQPIAICYAPSGAEADFRRWLGPAYAYWPQSGADLGDRMRQAFEDAFQRGARSACLMGSDLPALPPAYVMTAFERLHQYDSVLGPSPDGGYYLIGFQHATFSRDIFQGILWSQPTVYQATLARYAEHGLTYSALPPWDDVDTWTDLRRWYQQHRRHEGRAPRTCAYMRRLAAQEHPDGLYSGR
jgi:uncharacterized protein